MARKKICGIYMIKNIIDNKVYIGLSMDIHSRWISHKGQLRRNVHENSHLQSAWNKNCEENFEFNIIEECIDSKLSEREIYFIKLYNANNETFGYNFSTGGDRPTINRDRVIETALKNSKNVIQFTKEGMYITEFPNIIVASKLYNIENSALYQCCTGTLKSAYGYMWKFKKDCKDLNLIRNDTYNIEDYKIIPKSIPICQIDMKGSLIKEWDNCSRIEEFYHVSGENIRLCCNKAYGRKTYINFIWMYAEDYNKNGVDLKDYVRTKTIKSVSQYDLEGNFIKEYISAREAEKSTNIGYKMISRCCTGVREHTHGFIFKFSNIV